MNWKIYYGDGSTFDSTQGPVEEAPTIGVQVILQFHRDRGWQLLHSFDYYQWNERDGNFWKTDEPGFWQYMFRPGAKIIKFGTSVSTEDWETVLKRAIKDKDELEKEAA